MYAAIVPAGENRIRVFKARLVGSRDGSFAGLLDDGKIKGVILRPFPDEGGFCVYQASAVNAQSLHDAIVDLVVNGGLFSGLLHGVDLLLMPA